MLRNDDDLPTRPRPDLTDLEALIDESRQLGIPVTLEVVNETGRRPPLLVERTIYRLVQEALTNVHKHAGGARTRIRVEHTPDELLLSITNGRGTQPVEQAGLLGGGHGLLGLTERIRLVGGELTAGHTPDGGFQLLARVPIARQETP
ncbi:signal transduction histidine kinase [Lipingzhangella halophila]|uniref:histidine kinase n=1 Tax=Lipingzhangella halophila TaxID=1783352 RepID=A0A7W7W3M0_9ACTN|nr:ATP-binding protein [Lipingzhangella halophila]MBB4932926.1 signal transduction histidine kinase [Lipingzhangella halophila]